MLHRRPVVVELQDVPEAAEQTFPIRIARFRVTLRMEDIIHAMELVKRPTFDTVLLPSAWAKALPLAEEPAPLFGGMRVIESPFAKMPARVHKKRRWMSEAYHRRIQKKWNKRFGYVPAAFLMDMRNVIGMDFGRLPSFDIHGGSDG